MTEELKPCPFCGGEAELRFNSSGDGAYIAIHCKGEEAVCGAQAGFCWVYDLEEFESRVAHVASIWNKRV